MPNSDCVLADDLSLYFMAQDVLVSGELNLFEQFSLFEFRRIRINAPLFRAAFDSRNYILSWNETRVISSLKNDRHLKANVISAFYFCRKSCSIRTIVHMI